MQSGSMQPMAAPATCPNFMKPTPLPVKLRARYRAALQFDPLAAYLEETR
jgi:hypothetical protein